MMVALAGAEAQRKFAPKSLRSHHAHSDRESVFEYAFSLCGSSEEASALANLLRIRTRNLLHLPFVWSAVKAIAKKLLKEHEIKGKEAKAIYETASLPRSRKKIETIVYKSAAEAEAAGLTNLSTLLGNKPWQPT